MTKRIGVFSGTFDPFHLAHLEACLAAKAACSLDVITIMIDKEPRRKVNVTDYHVRLALMDLALQQYPGIRILECETSAVSTTSALQVLTQQFPVSDYYYILGSDVVEHMSAWPELDLLVKNFSLCVILRDNQERHVTDKRLNELKAQYPSLRYQVIPSVWSPVSSSKIRDEIKRTGKSQDVHPDVLRYITKNQIY